MPIGLDYSYAHPTLSCVKKAGYGFVARYIGDLDPNSAKYLDKQELNSILGLGLSVVVVRETTAGFMLTESGAAHARASRAHCNQLGLWGIPIYYALDVDPRGFTQSQNNAVHKFLADAAAVDGGGLMVGLYGSDDALDRFIGPNCRWGWQTYAWSTGRISPKAHFRQYKNGQAICGGTVDLNETYYPDYGQWPRPYETEDDLTPEQAQQLHDVWMALKNSASGDRIGDLWNQGTSIWSQLYDASDGRLGDIWGKLIEMQGQILAGSDIDEAEVAAQVLAVLTPEAIAAGIPDDIAEQVANELHQRLES